MDKQLLSVGIDVGTSTTQMIVSQLTVENQGGTVKIVEKPEEEETEEETEEA